MHERLNAAAPLPPQPNHNQPTNRPKSHPLLLTHPPSPFARTVRPLPTPKKHFFLLSSVVVPPATPAALLRPQQHLHALVGAPADGGRGRVEEHARPPAAPQRAPPLLLGNVPQRGQLRRRQARATQKGFTGASSTGVWRWCGRAVSRASSLVQSRCTKGQAHDSPHRHSQHAAPSAHPQPPPPTTAVLLYLRADSTPSVCSRVLTTSRGVVTAAGGGRQGE